MSTHRHARMLAALLVAAALANPAVAQTKITPDKNRYSPAQDVELGQEAAAEARKQLPMLNDGRVDDYVEMVGGRLVEAIPAEFRHPEFRLYVRGREPEGDQRVRASGRTDVPQPRDDRGVEDRGRNGRRDGARDLARRASPRHRPGDQGSEVPGRRDRRPDPGRDRRRRGWQRHRAGIAVRPRRLLPEVRPRVRAAGRPAGRADHGARRVRPARDGQHVQDDPGAGRPQRTRVAEQPPGPGQPLRRDSQ